MDIVNIIVLQFKVVHFICLFVLNQGPSSVSDIEVSTSTTVAAIRWKNSDTASPKYSYYLTVKAEDGSSVTNITDAGITFLRLPGLIPGSSYTVEISALVGNDTWSLVPGWKSFCMGE